MNRFRPLAIFALLFLFTLFAPALTLALEAAPAADATFVGQVFSPQVTAMCAIVTALIEGLIRGLPRFWETDFGDWLLGVLPFLLCALGALIPGVVPEGDRWDQILFGGMLGSMVSVSVRSFKRGLRVVRPAAPAAPPAA